MALSTSCQSDCKGPSPGSWKPGVVPREMRACQILWRSSGSEDEQISILRGDTSGLSCEKIIFPSVVLFLIQHVLLSGTMQVFHMDRRFCHVYLCLETLNSGGLLLKKYFFSLSFISFIYLYLQMVWVLGLRDL